MELKLPGAEASGWFWLLSHLADTNSMHLESAKQGCGCNSVGRVVVWHGIGPGFNSQSLSKKKKVQTYKFGQENSSHY